MNKAYRALILILFLGSVGVAAEFKVLDEARLRCGKTKEDRTGDYQWVSTALTGKMERQPDETRPGQTFFSYTIQSSIVEARLFGDSKPHSALLRCLTPKDKPGATTLKCVVRFSDYGELTKVPGFQSLTAELPLPREAVAGHGNLAGSSLTVGISDENKFGYGLTRYFVCGINQ